MGNNAEFYDHRLVLPPSPVQDDPDYGLAFTRVAGVYSSASRGGGRAGTNRTEAEAVARRLAERARARPDLSVGIVAFSKAQRDMVTEVLELARRGDAVLAWEGIGDGDGNPIDPSPEAIDALLDVWPILEAFQLTYVSKGLLLEQEKNASALSRTGPSAGATGIAKPARKPARTVRRGDRLGHVGGARAR